MQESLVVGFDHIYRSANEVEHSLVRYASSLIFIGSVCSEIGLMLVAKKDFSLS